MFSPSYSIRANEPYKLEFVKEENGFSLLSRTNSTVDEHIEHVVKDELDEDHLPSQNLFKQEVDYLEPVIVKKEEHEGDEVFIVPEQLHGNEDPECKEDAEAVGGSDNNAGVNSLSPSAWHLQKQHPQSSTDRGFVSTATQRHLGSRLPNSELECNATGPDLTSMEEHDFLRQTFQENKCGVKEIISNHCINNTDHIHLLQKHIPTEDSNHLKPFACKYCEYRTVHKSYLERHLLSHDCSKEKWFACNLCGYRTHLKNRLASHLLTHDSNRDKPLACQHCQYRTDNKHHFRRHLLSHDGNRDKPFACNHCNYRTNSKHECEKHILTHDGNRDKPFACNHCKYRSDRKSSLKEHLSTHDCNREKPFACNLCSYRAYRKNHLEKHILSHDSSLDKPFTCNHCRYRTDSEADLNAHLFTHNGNRQ